MSYLGCEVRYTLRTLKEEELFEAMKAAPKLIASSPFKWTLSSMLFISSFRIAWTLGTRMPPPRISIWWMSLAARPASARACLIGFLTRWYRDSHSYSNCSLVSSNYKVMESSNSGTFTLTNLFAERISLIEIASLYNRFIARSFFLTSGLPSLYLRELNLLARI